MIPAAIFIPPHATHKALHNDRLPPTDMLFASKKCFLAGILVSGLQSVASGQEVAVTLTAVGVDLLDASHILHFLDVVDAFGHVSVRNPVNSSQFLMTFAIAPAQATSQSIVTYEIENATAVALTFNASVTGAEVPTGFSERFIHSEIFKKFPNVLAVVHSHTQEILPFANQDNVPLVAQMHTSPSVGSDGAPIFDARNLPTSVLPDNQLHDLLIRNEALGDALAGTFSSDSQIVLMRGHGMAVRADSMREAVFSSYYIKQDATVQFQGILLGGGKAPKALNAREVTDTATTAKTLVGRAWALWASQVDNAGLYVNDLRHGAPPSPTGF
ncbi:arad-like aldolase/epimerase [Mycena rosella]|uniref:Arad-like aldolase/epimerase n=1 Tax=Mycena rosella TaxID=1033263 RepID=A0AAD7CW59_MYCRO|nr:arad-like aldolase/epimerase [Mycena rosella]